DGRGERRAHPMTPVLVLVTLLRFEDDLRRVLEGRSAPAGATLEPEFVAAQPGYVGVPGSERVFSKPWPPAENRKHGNRHVRHRAQVHSPVEHGIATLFSFVSGIKVNLKGLSERLIEPRKRPVRFPWLHTQAESNGLLVLTCPCECANPLVDLHVLQP